jgi:CRISPR-associated exonuclease Cas4
MNFEDDSEDVHIGRILHEIRSEITKNAEVLMDGIRMDQITAEYVLEMKKSDADIEAARWQTLYYLYVLKLKGIVRKGKIQFTERNKQAYKTVELELDEEHERGVVTLIEDIKSFLEQEVPPEPIQAKTCDRCAYYSYCYI